MKLKQTTLATALTAALAMGLSGQAAASVYAGSSLHIKDLTVAILDSGGVPAVQGGVTVDSFNYNLTNTAVLNGVLAGTTATCFGTPASNNCGVPPANTLDALAANAPGSTFNRVNNQTAGDGTLKWFGVGGGDWSNSDSVIYTSQLTAGIPTHTDQIAESNIDFATSAAANAEIKSVTGFTFVFTVADPGLFSLNLNFLADPDMRAQILNDNAHLFSAGSNMNVSFSLSQNERTGGGPKGFVNWNPEGTFGDMDGDGDVDAADIALSNDCQSNLTCVEVADAEDLNKNVGTSTNNTTDDHSHGPNILGLGSYGINVQGLTAGKWTLTLNAVTSTVVTRVPEPGVLALLGIGLAGLGLAYRRRSA